MIDHLKLMVSTVVLNWGFVFGLLFATAVYSKYIFGPDNLYEEAIELLNKVVTGNDMDISPETLENPERDLNRYIPYK